MTPTLTLIAYDEFVAAVRGLAAALAADDWRPDLLVGIGRGGLAPAVFLSHATGLPMVSVDVSTPIAAFNADLTTTLAARTNTGERLLVIEDINDSGGTITALRAQLVAANADLARVRFAVLIDNVTSNARVEYAHRVIDRRVTKDWFVFPWEAMAPQAAIVADAAEVPERIA